MATECLFVRNLLLLEVTSTFSFKTLRYFSSGSFAVMFQYPFDETYIGTFKFNRANVIATVCPTTQIYYFRTSGFFFKESRLSLIKLLLFYTTGSGEYVCYSISSETIDTVIWLKPLPIHSHFRSETIFQFFLGKSRLQRICVHFQLFELVNITEYGEKV